MTANTDDIKEQRTANIGFAKVGQMYKFNFSNSNLHLYKIETYES